MTSRAMGASDGEGADQRVVAARLRRQVPELALAWLADDPDRLWQTVEGTLCFADVSGFTALAERLEGRGRRGAEELIDTLNRVFGAILEVAAGRGGSLLKFGGDALLFLFHGPDHARRAAATATAMHASCGGRPTRRRRSDGSSCRCRSASPAATSTSSSSARPTGSW